MARTDIVPALWEWKSDTGWVCFGKDLCKAIEASYQSGVSGATYAISGWSYSLSFPSFQQTNTTTKRVRSVRRRDDRGPIWMWESDYEYYRRYDANLEDMIENQYQAFQTRSSPISAVLTWKTFSIDVSAMKQENTINNRERCVRRFLVDPRSTTGQNAPVTSAPQNASSSTTRMPSPRQRVGLQPNLLVQGSVTCRGEGDSYVSLERASKCFEDAVGGFTGKDCMICLEQLQTDVVEISKCQHMFHRNCIIGWVTRGSKYGFDCPTCKTHLLKGCGDCPSGTMKWEIWENRPEYQLAGYSSIPTITIQYQIPSGIQGRRHPTPGARFSGTSRCAYLPDTDDGQTVLKMLVKAFSSGYTFTVGTSVTTGMADTVVWNGIHHKTKTHGGSSHFGYPDVEYFHRVVEELRSKGIKPTECDSEDEEEEEG